MKKNIGIGKGNLARKKFDPIYEKLSEIEKSSEPPQAKLARVRNEIVPQLEAWSEQDSVDHFPKAEINALSELSNSVAIVLRGISIEANNNHDDMGTAANAIVLAGVYTKEKELEKRVAANLKQLNEIHQEQGKNNLRLFPKYKLKSRAKNFVTYADLLKANEFLLSQVRHFYIHA